MKHILIPTDFSENANNAIQYALSLFEGEKCKIYFLHTYTPVFYRMDYAFGGPGFSAIPDANLDQSLEDLNETLRTVRQKFSNDLHDYQLLSAFNFLADEVDQIIHREGIDIIVMGTQGATGAKEVFLGTNAVQVMRKSDAPVIVVPKGYGFSPIKKILYPTDYMNHYKLSELYPLIELAKKQKASITVLHVVEEDEMTEVQVRNKKFLDACLETVDHEFIEDRINYMPMALIEFLEKNKFDLLCMMNRKHSFLERILLRQNIDFVGFHSKIPLMALRDTAKISA